jgi:hypothetical protein
MKMMWDEQYLYLLAKLEEPDLWATLTERDAIIFQDHDFEVFIDPDNDIRGGLVALDPESRDQGGAVLGGGINNLASTIALKRLFDVRSGTPLRRKRVIGINSQFRQGCPFGG